jgi:hypothetical protein
VSHALRSLVKRGDPAALAVLGYGDTARIRVDAFDIAPARPVIGAKVVIRCRLHNPTSAPQRVIADLRVHFVKANGSTSVKVFKLSAVELAAGGVATLRKTISLAQLTTRKHYPGIHRVELQLNGDVTPLGVFTLRRAAGSQMV